MKKGRLRTYVVWLHNHVDHRDDEWRGIKARSLKEAFANLKYDEYRFAKGSVYTIPEFREVHGDLPIDVQPIQ